LTSSKTGKIKTHFEEFNESDMEVKKENGEDMYESDTEADLSVANEDAAPYESLIIDDKQRNAVTKQETSTRNDIDYEA
jgi:hypothetical protein